MSDFKDRFSARVVEIKRLLGERSLLAERADFSSVGDILSYQVNNAEDVRRLIRALDIARAAIDAKCLKGPPFRFADSAPTPAAISAKRNAVVTALQFESINLARELHQLLKDAGTPPELSNRGSKPADVSLEKWIADRTMEALQWQEQRAKWVEQILYQYQRDFAQRVEQVILSAGIEGIPIYDCNPMLARNKIHNDSDVRDLIGKLWQLFIQLEEKSNAASTEG